MNALISSSGGKDSLMAFQRAQQQGFNITTIVMMFDETGERSRSQIAGLRTHYAQRIMV
jgi:diphthamide synthase (EF-2-diphthine--ammonia ligase)